jgi:hypothetical protein
MVSNEPQEKTARKTAKPSPVNGVQLPVGAHLGNTGGKPGRSGRPPDAFKAICRELVTRNETLAAVRKILRDPNHPAFVGALKWATEHGYGRPLQRVEADGKVTLTIRLVRELGEGPVRTVVSDRALGPGGIRGPVI